METRQRRFSIAYVVLAAIALIVIQSVLYAQQAANLSYGEFKVLVKGSQVTDVVLGKETITGTLSSEGLEGLLPRDKLAVRHQKGYG